MATRKESAADVAIELPDEGEIVVERLSLTKDIDVEGIYGSGRTFPDGYAINEVSYQGTMELVGNRLDLRNVLFDDNGLPKDPEGIVITVTHHDGSVTAYEEILVTSEGYEMNSGETTTTTFEFMAFASESHNVTDVEP